MKPHLFLAAFFALMFNVSSKAQQWDGSAGTTGNIYRYGDISVYYNSSNAVSIGAAWGDLGYGTGYLGFNLSRNNHSNGLWTYNSDGSSNGSCVIYGDVFGNLMFSNRITTGNTSGTVNDNEVVSNIKMRVQNDGKVVIGNVSGITTPGSYKLYVETGILTERVRVALKTTNDWADYVFKNGYNLLPISEVDNYIKINKHLPGIPSAEEMIKNGNDLAQTDALLLQKIEELTLYIIKLNKINDALSQQVELLQQNSPKNLLKLLESMQEEINALKQIAK